MLAELSEKNHEPNELQPIGTEDPGNADGNFTQKIFPAGLTQEVKQLSTIAWPITLTSFFTFVCTPIALIFCGHLGTDELDAATLATSIANVTGVFVCVGLSSACDTLFSQAFGAKNLKMLGVQFQMSLIILSLACCICWTVQLNAEYLLILLHQDPAISRSAADYLLFFTPGLLCNFVFQVSVKFLQNQNIVIPPVVLGLIGNVFNVIMQYILVIACDLRVRGSAIAQAASWLVTALGTLCYIKRCGVLEHTWDGWSLQALEDWGYFVKLAVSGLLMTFVECMAFESGVFLCGMLGITQQAAMSVALQIDWCLYVMAFGLGIACSIRVGQNLGAGHSCAARTTFVVALLILAALDLFCMIVLISLKDVAGFVFTNDSSVAEMVSGIIPIMCVLQLCGVSIDVCGGALRGCGKQWIGGVLNLLGYGFVAIPAIVLLIFYTDLEVRGFWWGIVCGMGPISLIYILVMFCIDWNKEAAKAVKRNKQEEDLNWKLSDVPGDCLTTKASKEVSPLLDGKPAVRTSRRVLIAKRAAACGLILLMLMTGVFVRVFVNVMD